MDGSESNSPVDFRVGKATPLGGALRRYWIPACFSDEVAEPDCDPIRLKLLGESFVAFRDSGGTVGILDEHCPHRKASLVFGRNEHGGLRCLWHHWKFATDGSLIETPNTLDCTLKDRVRARAYPVRESGGIVWTYLGAREHEPRFHEYGWSTVDAGHRVMGAVELDCNFSKGLESLMDSSHVSLLHEDSMRRSAVFRASISSNSARDVIDGAPELRIEATDFGFHYASLRDSTSQRVQARLSVYVAPYLCFVAPENSAFISVPRDDHHMRLYIIAWSPRIAITPALRADWLRFMGLDPSILDSCGMSPHPRRGPLEDRNRFVQDRVGMRSGATFSGLPGLTAEDAAMITSIPGVSDYSGEHLTSSDAAIVQLRRVLWKLARSESDATLPALHRDFNSASVNSCSKILKNSDEWKSMAIYLR